MVDAWLQYDQGEFAAAEVLAKKAISINPNSEDATLALAFTYLALGGIEPFTVTEKLMDQQAEKAKEKATGEDDSSSTNTLSSLTTIFELSDADMGNMGKLDGLDTDEDLTDYFGGLPVYIPSPPGDQNTPDSPRSKVNTLKNANLAITTICPFIDPEVFAEADYSSYIRYTCTQQREI